MAEAQAVEAGVDLQVTAEPGPARPAGGAERLRRAGRRHGRCEVVGEDAADVAHAERAEDEDAPAIAGLAQLDALLEIGDREPLRSRLAQRAGHAHRAVPVGVGLDHGEDARHAAVTGGGAVVEIGLRGQVRGEGAVVGLHRCQVHPR